MATNQDSDNAEAADDPLYYEILQGPAAPTMESLTYVLDCDSDHKKFLPVDRFTESDLPSDIRCKEVYKLIHLNIDLTVRVCSQKQNQHQIQQRQQQQENSCGNQPHHGSGSICYFSDTHDMFPCHHLNPENCQRCHIPGCPYLSSMGENHFVVTSQETAIDYPPMENSHLAFRVSTNQHVVSNDLVANEATVELFYHSEDRKDVVVAKVACVGEIWEEQDKVHLVCVCDMNARVKQLLQTMRHKMIRLFAAIPSHIKTRFIENHVIVVSHPHGVPKVVSIGRKDTCVQKYYHDGRKYVETRYQAQTCRGSSGGPVVGPGWEHGGPGYRVHCGSVRDRGTGQKLGLSKSFWIVGSDPRGGAESAISEHPEKFSTKLKRFTGHFLVHWRALYKCFREMLFHEQKKEK